MKPPHLAMQRIPSQLAFILLALVYNARPTYLLQSLNPTITQHFCERFDVHMNTCLGAVFRMCPNDPTFSTLRALSLGQGGLGIANKAGPTAESAYAVAQARAHVFIEAMVPALSRVDPMCYSTHPWPRVEFGVATGSDALIELSNEDRGVLTTGFVEDEIKGVVKGVRERADCARRVVFEKMLVDSTFPKDRHRLVLFRSGACKDAGRWVHDVLSFTYGPKYFPSEWFVLAMRMRLLEDVTDAAGNGLSSCGCCAASGCQRNLENERRFLHSLSCMNTYQQTQRHDGIRDLLCAMLKSHIGKGEEGELRIDSVSKEESIGDGVTAVCVRSVRMDVVVRASKGGVSHIYLLDAAVVNPMSRMPPSGAIVPFAAVKARAAEKVGKLRRDLPLLDLTRNVKFVPFVVEVTGRLGPEALGLLEVLQIPGELRRSFSRDLSVHLARYNGKMLSMVRKATLGARSDQLGV
jgi:hypothetical protein